MYSSSYQGGGDAGSLFGGGGFMPTQSPTQAASDPSKRGGGSQSNGLLPLTVKQLSEASQKASDDSFYVDGVDVNNVTLVGMVFNKEEKPTDISFLLDDGTGRIEVRRWIDGQDTQESLEMNAIQNGAYVRVHGHLRSFQNKINIVAFSVRPVVDFNEVTFHFLECIFVHLYNVKSNGGSQQTQGGSAGTNYNAYGGGGQTNTSTYNTSVASHGRAHNQYTQQAAAVGGSMMNDCQRRVYAIFEEPASVAAEAGLHINDVIKRMAGFSAKQVKDAVEFLVNEGLIYSTIDDDHFKSTTG